jgi:hypothetical protein
MPASWRFLGMIRRVLTIGVLCLSLTVPALAQKGQKGSNVRKFQKTLGLTADQTSTLQALLAERDRQLETLRTAGKSKGRKQNIQEQFQSSVRAILTPEQVEIFDRGAVGKKEGKKDGKKDGKKKQL